CPTVLGWPPVADESTSQLTPMSVDSPITISSSLELLGFVSGKELPKGSLPAVELLSNRSAAFHSQNRYGGRALDAAPNWVHEDFSCYGATRVKTPNVDKLARRGIRFTDAHSSAATCTPTRYSLMTGEYAFRKRGTGILPGDAALIVDPARTTLASVMKQAGYTTGCAGKWHLGLGKERPDWNDEI